MTAPTDPTIAGSTDPPVGQQVDPSIEPSIERMVDPAPGGGVVEPDLEPVECDGVPVSARNLVRNLVVLAVLLVAVAALTDLWSPWTSDDGSYAVATRLVRDDATWRLPDEPAWAEGLTEPAMANGTVTDAGVHPYVRQPAWIVTLVATTGAFGEPVGFYVVQLVAAAGTACLAWAIARRLHPPAADLAFWATAGAPLVVWTFGLWAHAPLAAVGGVTAFGLVALARSRRPSGGVAGFGPVLIVAGAVAAATALRTEGLVLAGAAAVAVAWVRWTDPSGDGPAAAGVLQRAIRAAWPAALVVVAGLGARVLTSRWAGHLVTGASVGDAGSLAGGSGFVTGRVDGALATLASTRYSDTGAFVLAMVALVLAVLAGRRVADERCVDAPAVALAGGWLVVVVARSVVHPLDHLSGLLVAAPFVTVGLLCLRRADLGRGEQVLAVFTAVYVVGVLATQYSVGGGHEWGGRFLSGALVALVVLAATAFTRRAPRRGSARTPGSDRTRAAFLGLVVLAPAIVGVVVTNHTRAERSAGAAAVEVADTRYVISLDPAGAHLAWRTVGEHTWMTTTPDDLVPLLQSAFAAGEREITVYAAEPDAVAEVGCDVEPITRAVLRLTC